MNRKILILRIFVRKMSILRKILRIFVNTGPGLTWTLMISATLSCQLTKLDTQKNLLCCIFKMRSMSFSKGIPPALFFLGWNSPKMVYKLFSRPFSENIGSVVTHHSLMTAKYVDVKYKFYADETQLFIHLSPGNCANSFHRLKGLNDIWIWMFENKLS